MVSAVTSQPRFLTWNVLIAESKETIRKGLVQLVLAAVRDLPNPNNFYMAHLILCSNSEVVVTYSKNGIEKHGKDYYLLFSLPVGLINWFEMSFFQVTRIVEKKDAIKLYEFVAKNTGPFDPKELITPDVLAMMAIFNDLESCKKDGNILTEYESYKRRSVFSELFYQLEERISKKTELK